MKKFLLLILVSATQSYAQAKNPNDYLGYLVLNAHQSNVITNFISCNMSEQPGPASVDCIDQGPLFGDASGYFSDIIPRRQYASAYTIKNSPTGVLTFYQCKIEPNNTLGDCALLKPVATEYRHFMSGIEFLPDLSATKNNSAAYVFTFVHASKRAQLLMCPEYSSAPNEIPSLHLDQCVESGLKENAPDYYIAKLGEPAINPAGTFLYYAYDNDFTQCSIDQKTHLLSACKKMSLHVDLPDRPLDIQFDPTGAYAYLSGRSSGIREICDVNTTDGGISNCRPNTEDPSHCQGAFTFNTTGTHAYFEENITSDSGTTPAIVDCLFDQKNGTFSQCNRI